MELGSAGAELTVTAKLLAVPLPQLLDGVTDKVPEEVHVTETELPVPVIVAADEGVTFQV
jgi:hypothetical protein